MYKVIYTNGCSWTSGVEAANDILFPNLNSAQIRKIKADWCRLGHYNKEAEVYYAEKEAAWPNRVSKLIGIDVINRSHGGSGQEQIDITTKEDLLGLLEKFKPTDILALIQCTIPFRALFPNDGSPFYHESKWASVLVDDNNSKAEKATMKGLAAWPDEYIVCKYHKDILSTIDFCVARGIDIKLIQMYDYNNFSNVFLPQIQKYYLGNAYLSTLCEGNTCEGGHPNAKGQLQIAHYVMQQLNLKL